MAKKPYVIGYGRPPSETRFKPGQSGNKKGRKKTVSTFADLVLEEMNALQTIDKNGVQIRIPMKRILAKQLLRAAGKGNTRALLVAIEYLDDGLLRKEKAEEAALRATRIRPDLSKLSTDELTALYFETLKGIDE